MLRVLSLVGQNLITAFKKNPTMVRLSLVSLLTSLAIFTPEQLAGIDRALDLATPVLVILMGYELRGKVIPANGLTGALPAPAPVSVPQAKPAGPSGAF